MKHTTHDRLFLLHAVFFICGLIVIARLFQLQVVEHESNRALAAQDSVFERGEIFVHDGNGVFPIAINEKTFEVFLDPAGRGDLSRYEPLGALLGSEPEELKSRIAAGTGRHTVLAHYVPELQAQQVRELQLPGMYVVPEPKRRYPAGTDFASVTGFLGYVGDERRGQYGVEERYHDLLAGNVPSARGDLLLTLEYDVQKTICQKLRAAVERAAAELGTVIVMNPKTGAIISLCSFPTYDPNQYNQVSDVAVYRTPQVTDSFEPGSIFKPITMASALDAGVVEPYTEFTDTGSARFGKFTIKNALDRVYGTVTMTDVLDLSINTGSIFVAQHLGNDLFAEYVKAFGFGSRTGIDLPNEVSGSLDNIMLKKDIYTATASFGQGISVSSMQIVRAYAALANGGFLVRPYVAEAIRMNGGATVSIAPSQNEVVSVISRKTSMTISAMLGSVVKHGHAKVAQVPGYFIAGKTGTAQVADAHTGGYGNETIHTFAGFFPLEEPQFVVLARLDKPKKGLFADSTTAPLFKEVAAFLLQYYKIPPSEKE